MRLSLLCAVVIFAAAGEPAQAQKKPESPKASPDLPKIEKPKPAAPPEATPPDPEETADPDPNAKPVVNPPVKPGRGRASSEPASGEPNDPNSGGPEYTGPAILSRGISFIRPSLPANERFRPFVGMNLYHDSGVTGPYQGLAARTDEAAYSGADVNYGISGQHSRRFDTIQLDYRGHAFLNSKYSSQDQALSLSYSRVLTRRLRVTLSEAAGLYANNFSVLNSVSQTDTSVANTGLVVTPNTESFDDRTYYSSTQGDLTFQKNSRLSLDIGASVFNVHRDSLNLISANGFQTRSDVAYRFSKKITIGPYYAYSRYYYSGTFGDTGIHTAGLNYSLALNKSLQFRVRVGGTRLETRGLQQVLLDPRVSQLLGVAVGIERYYTIAYLPDFAVELSKTYRHSDFSFSYLRGVSPGNGVILTSRRDSESLAYTYSGIRRYALTLGAGRDVLASSTQSLGNYHGYYVRAALSRSLPHNLQALMSFDYRKLGFTAGEYARDQFRITLGFAFTPGLGPLKFW